MFLYPRFLKKIIMEHRYVIRIATLVMVLILGCQGLSSQKVTEDWDKIPVKALFLAPPRPGGIDEFCHFVKDALPREGINTLILRFNYGYKFESHPELIDMYALSKEEVQQITQACLDAGVRLIPKINLLAHQSEQTQIGKLLIHYPEFDESPGFDPPSPWIEPSARGGFYSKCLCPQHPDLYKVIFPLIDELIDVCQADAFHVGLDEAWIVAHESCSRCFGADPAVVFANHIKALHMHLKKKNCEMWMWSDRLIDGYTTGLGAWQACMNETHRAINMIPKDIVICDWKYEDAPPTPEYFAIKGFNVVVCTCVKADVGIAQMDMLNMVRQNGKRQDYSCVLSSRLRGFCGTAWEPAYRFIKTYYGQPTDLESGAALAFKKIIEHIRELEKRNKTN